MKARVVDLSEIPWFIGCSEDEDFEGESWTAQCEILQATLLGGGPRYEGIPPNGPEDVQPNLFQFFFGFRQPGQGPVEPDGDAANAVGGNQDQNVNEVPNAQ